MSGLSTATKGRVGLKAGKTVAKRPQVLGTAAKAGTKVARPAAKLGARISKRKARRQAHRAGAAASAVSSTLIAYAPSAVRQLGLLVEEAPPRKRTAPRVAVGIVIGAGAVYFLEPERGAERRRRVGELVG